MPLSHIKVADLTRARAGPTCVRQLSEMGAQIIKVEAPGFEDDGTGERHHFDFQSLQVNKRSLTLDLKTAAGRAVLIKLVKLSDVLVENYRPSVKDRLRIDYATLSAINPRLVYASISGFGQTGPYRERAGLDTIAQGLSGVMTVNGGIGSAPLRVGLPLADLTSGFMAAYGVVVALLERERSGHGQWVHTSLLQAMIRLMDFQANRWLTKGEVPTPAGNYHPLSQPAGMYQARDGQVIVQAGGRLFRRLCEALDAPELAVDPRFANGALRVKHRDQLSEEIERRLVHRDAQDWVERLAKAGVPAGPVLNVRQCFEDEQVKTLPVAATVHHPILGTSRVVGHGVNLERTPPRIHSAAPEFGEHSDEILGELGYSAQEIADLRKDGVV